MVMAAAAVMVMMMMMFYAVIDSTKSPFLFKLFDVAQIETTKIKKYGKEKGKEETKRTFTKFHQSIFAMMRAPDKFSLNNFYGYCLKSKEFLLWICSKESLVKTKLIQKCTGTHMWIDCPQNLLDVIQITMNFIRNDSRSLNCSQIQRKYNNYQSLSSHFPPHLTVESNKKQM